MYAQNQTSNRVPPVRPRSSLSKNEHQHHARRRKSSNVIITLAGFCVFLFILCAFLLGALVLVGRTLAERADFQFIEQNNATNYSQPKALLFRLLTIVRGLDGSGGVALRNDSQFVTKPILRFPSSTPTTRTPQDLGLYRATASTLPAHIMNTSKVLQQISYRLPRELRPQHYQLRLQPNLLEKSYTGNVTIRLEVLKPIAFIPVHAKTLNISTERVQQLNSDNTAMGEVLPVRTFMHSDYEYWITEFAQPLTVGNYSLTLSFNGSLANRIAGFYQSSYLDKKRNEQRWIATSKFEPTYARSAFPCFDEPAMKAIFSVTLVRPTGDGYHALSNLNIEHEKVLGDVTEVHFADTVPMSTYLACFIVSDFAHKSAEVRPILPDTKPIEMRVFSTAAQVNKVTYALETGVGITEFYIEYFGIPYPLPKLDMAAIPDFVSGAMEHWGLVTYRETALLYDPTISSSSNKQRVATVIAHELAHMWFGNLVTMKWWNDLWLNEGFASYIEYKGVNKVHPDWKMLDQFLIMDLHQVMSLDATLAAHPIVQSVESPSQITELFDSITYSKGASIVRMLEDLVGPEKFRNATKNYLIKYRFGNAETDDFLSEIEALNFDFDVKQIMQTWTTQMGLPVVEVTKDNENSYKLKQKRFFSNPEDYNETYTDSQFNYHWSIPITYYTSENSEVNRTLFNYNDNEVSISVPESVKWIKINKDQVGYYRINYPTEMWNALIQALRETPQAFSVADRAHLINDAFALADATQINYTIALDLTTYLQHERDYVSWSVANSRLNAIKNLLYSTDIYSDFVTYVRQLLNNIYAAVSWDSTNDHLSNLLRSNILNAACRYGNQEALQQAANRFDAWLLNSTVRPSPDIRSTIYYYGMQVSGNEQKWQQVWDLYVAEEDAQEKLKLMDALAAIKEPWLLERYINLAWDENLVRGQDYFTCLRYISQNPAGRSLVWDYVRENWPRLVERFGINERYLGRLIPGITSRFATNTKLAEMETFFALYPNAGAGTAARKEALEKVKYNIKWLQQNKAQVANWLALHYNYEQNITTTTTTTATTRTPTTTTSSVTTPSDANVSLTTLAANFTTAVEIQTTTTTKTTMIESLKDLERNPIEATTTTEILKE